MTFPNHINEMHDEDYPALIAVPEVTESLDTWEMPEIQYAGEFTNYLPVNELLAHVMNCDACEHDTYVLVRMGEFFTVRADIMMHESAVRNSEMFPALTFELRKRIVSLETVEAAKYESLISRVNSLHEHDINFHMKYTLHGNYIEVCNCGDYVL